VISYRDELARIRKEYRIGNREYRIWNTEYRIIGTVIRSQELGVGRNSRQARMARIWHEWATKKVGFEIRRYRRLKRMHADKKEPFQISDGGFQN